MACSTNGKRQHSESTLRALEDQMEFNMSMAEILIDTWPKYQCVEEQSLKPYKVIQNGKKKIKWPIKLKFAICMGIEDGYRQNPESALGPIKREVYFKLELSLHVTWVHYSNCVPNMIESYQKYRREIGNPDTACYDIEYVTWRCPFFFHIHKALSYSHEYRDIHRLIDLEPKPTTVDQGIGPGTSDKHS